MKISSFLDEKAQCKKLSILIVSYPCEIYSFFSKGFYHCVVYVLLCFLYGKNNYNYFWVFKKYNICYGN